MKKIIVSILGVFILSSFGFAIYCGTGMENEPVCQGHNKGKLRITKGKLRITNFMDSKKETFKQKRMKMYENVKANRDTIQSNWKNFYQNNGMLKDYFLTGDYETVRSIIEEYKESLMSLKNEYKENLIASNSGDYMSLKDELKMKLDELYQSRYDKLVEYVIEGMEEDFEQYYNNRKDLYKTNGVLRKENVKRRILFRNNAYSKKTQMFKNKVGIILERRTANMDDEKVNEFLDNLKNLVQNLIKMSENQKNISEEMKNERVEMFNGVLDEIDSMMGEESEMADEVLEEINELLENDESMDLE